MANDTKNVQRGIVGEGSGDDTYVLSANLIDANAQITITDVEGANSIQLIGGLTITSSKVAGDTAQLTLSNGAVVTVLGASSMSYVVGGDPLQGVAGTTKDYAAFAQDVLQTTVPTDGTVNDGTQATVNTDGSVTTDGSTPPPTPVPGETYALTTGADARTGTANDDTFVATENTLSSADVLNGGDGNDTLRYASSGNAAVNESGFEASNIETIQVTSDALNGTAFDVTGVSDLQTLRNYNSSEDLALTGMDSLTDIELSDVGSAGATANDTTPDTTLVFDAAVVAGSDDALNVKLDGNLNVDGTNVGTLTAQGIETFNLTTEGAASRIATVASGTVKTINVAGDQDLDIVNNLVGATTIDANTLTGKLNVVADSGARDVVVTGGNNDDRADFSNGWDKDDAFDGGDGTDTLGLTYGVSTAIVAANSGAASNVEILDVTNAATANGTIDMDNFAGVEQVILNGGINTGITTTIDDAVTGLTVELDVDAAATGSLVVDLKTDGTADELTLTLDNIDAGDTVASLSAEDAETLNISADDDTTAGNGTLNIASLTASDAKTLNLSGDADITLANTVDPATAVLTTINAATATGDVVINGTNTAASGATITLGSGDDIFNVATSSGADTFTLGAGKDTVVYNAAAQSSGLKTDTITDFVQGEDTLNVTALGINTSALFLGNATDSTAAETALSGTIGVPKTEAVFIQSEGVLVVDVDGDGNIGSADLRVKLDNVTTLTAADLGLGNGVTFTANQAAFNTATAAHSSQNNAVSNEGDVINATVAQVAGSSINGLLGTDTLNLTGTSAGAEIADLAAIGFTGVESVTLDSAVEGVVMNSADLSATQVSKLTGNSGTIQSLTVNAGTDLTDTTITNVEALSITGAVTMNVAQHNAWNAIDAAGGADTIILGDAGTVTGDADVETYQLGGTTNNAFTLGAAGQTVTGSAGVDVVTANGLTLTGNLGGFNGADTLAVSTGANLSAATGVGFGTLTMAGTVSMTEAQHNAFATVAAAGAGDTVVVTDQFSVGNSRAGIETYDLNGVDNTIQLQGTGTNVLAGAGNDVVNVATGLTLDSVSLNGEGGSGAANLLGDNNDTIHLSHNANISAATISGFEQMAITDNASVSMTAAQFGAFSNLLSGSAFNASGTETLTITDAVSDSDVGTLAQVIENYVLASTGDDSFGVEDVTTAAPTINISAGGSDIIALDNNGINAVANAVVVTGFDVTNDDLRSSDNTTAHNSGFETVTAADANVVTAADGVIEIASSVTQFLNATDVADGGSVETALVNSIAALGDGTFTVVGYGNNNAYIYQVEMSDAGLTANDLELASEITVELIGQLNNVAADSLDGANFA